MNISKLVDETYSSVEGKCVRKVNNSQNDLIKKLHERLEVWKLITSNPDFYDDSLQYANHFYETLREIPYGRDEITKLSFEFQQYENSFRFERIGNFLTTLINLHYESKPEKEEYTLITQEMRTPYTKIGIGSSATIRVIGNVGEKVGWESTGTIIVQGNAGIEAGFRMRDGKLIIEGNAGYSVGEQMMGGVIHVKKDARDNIGGQMTGGEIHIEGECGKIGSIILGKIFHQGNCIRKR